MGLGGTIEGFRVFIPENLENCTARDSCPTYENGRLISNGEEFEIDTLEIWGCGGNSRVEKALKAQQANRRLLMRLSPRREKLIRHNFLIVHSTENFCCLIPSPMIKKSKNDWKNIKIYC